MQDGEIVLPETSIIIDYLQERHPGSIRLIPADSDAAREVSDDAGARERGTGELLDALGRSLTA